MSAAGLRFPMCGVCRLPSLSRAFQITDVRKYLRCSSFKDSGSKNEFILCTKIVCQSLSCPLLPSFFLSWLVFSFSWQLVLEAHNVPELSAGVNCTFEDLAEMDGLVEGNRITCSSPAEKEVPRIVVDQGAKVFLQFTNQYNGWNDWMLAFVKAVWTRLKLKVRQLYNWRCWIERSAPDSREAGFISERRRKD